MTSHRVPRPPLAVVALAAILAITAAWWALALWPLDERAPEWVVVTREVCFGATHTGLPHAGGWLLLIGEPLGMLAILAIVWGGELRVGLQRVHAHLAGRIASVAVLGSVATGLVAAGQRVAAARGLDAPTPFLAASPLPPRSALPAAPLALPDHRGLRTDLADFRGRWVMITFAFGHCDDICPVIVEHVKRARTDEGATQVPLVVVSLDPWRDTADRLPGIARSWALGPEDRLLSGDVPQVNAALDAWHVPRTRDERSGEIYHGSIIVLIDPDGRVAWRVEGAPQRIREALAQVVREASGR